MVSHSDFHKLQDTISKLQLEISHLKNEKNCVVERFVDVQPPDYLALKNNCQIAVNEVKILKNRCHILEHILKHGQISPLTNLIADYKSMSNFYLRQLVKEIEVYRASADERSHLLDFLNYLRSVTHEVEELLIVDEH